MGKALVIQMTGDNIRIAAMQLGNRAQLIACTELDTPEGAITDGVIRDVDVLAELIRKAMLRPGLEGIKRVIFALCTTQVISERVTIPKARGESAEKIIAANMDIYFPVDVSDYQVTQRVVGVGRDENGRKNILIQLWAIPKEILNRYYTLALACGLSVAAIDYCGNSLAAISGTGKEEDKTEVCLMAEPEMLIMTIMQAGKMSMQRSFYSGNGIETALSEAELVLEYHRSFNGRNGGCAEAVICGSLAEQSGFNSRVSDVLGIPLRVHECACGTVWSVCLGAAQTELDFGERKNAKSLQGALWHYGVVLVGGVAAIMSLAVFLGSGTLWKSELSAMRERENAMYAQSLQYSDAAQEYADYTAEYDALVADYESVADTLQTCDIDVWPVLRELDSKLPEGVRIKELSVKREGLSAVFSCPDKEKAATLIAELRKMKLIDVEELFELADEPEDGVRFGVSLLFSELFFDVPENQSRIENMKPAEKLEVEQ